MLGWTVWSLLHPIRPSIRPRLSNQGRAIMKWGIVFGSGWQETSGFYIREALRVLIHPLYDGIAILKVQ